VGALNRKPAPLPAPEEVANLTPDEADRLFIALKGLRPKKPRKSPKAKVHLTPEEVERFFAVCKDVRDAAIFRIMYHRGLRASEIGMLQLSDWSSSTGRLQVHRLKGSYSLDYQIKPVEVKALRAWLRVRGSAPGPLFPSRNKQGISRFRLFALMRQYCAAAGIAKEKAHPHAWKHTCGTSNAEQGADLLDIKELLGHANIQNSVGYIDHSGKRRDRFAEKTKDWK
jgi:type 1 fimbriae regulatory protein FimB